MLYERLESEKSESRFQASILKLKIWRIQLVELSDKVIKSNGFDNAVIAVIVSNSIYLAIDDYYMQNNPSQEVQRLRSIIENTFSGLYISEFLIKVCGMGFVWNSKSYLRDYWNIMDFLIILQVLISWIFASLISFKLNSLRVVRVLRPLKTLKSVEGLKILVISVFHSLPLLRDTFIILGFFYLLFALAGLHIFFGKFKNRCVYEYSGSIDPLNNGSEMFCSQDSDCPPSYFCGRTLVPNPNLDMTSFDDFFTAILTVFQCVTLEGWSDVMKLSMKTIHPLAALFFILLIFFGAFFMVNLTLAVITNKVTEAHSMYEEYRRYMEWQKKHMYRALSFIDAKILDEQEDQEARQNGRGLDDEDESPNKRNSQILDNASAKKMYEQSKMKELEQRGFTIRGYKMGKWAAQKMIEFLRRRQQERVERELQEKMEKKAKRNRRKNSSSPKKIQQIQKRLNDQVNNKEIEAQPEKEDSQNESKEVSSFMSESNIESSIIDEQKFNSDNNGVQNKNSKIKNQIQVQNLRILDIEEEKEPHIRKFQTDFQLSLLKLDNLEDEKIKEVAEDPHQPKFDSPRSPLLAAAKTQIVEQNDPDLIEDDRSNISPILEKAKKFTVQATKGLEVLEKVKNGYGLRHLMKISGKYFIAPQFQSPYTRAKESFIQKNDSDKFIGKNPVKKQINTLNIVKIRALLNEHDRRKEQDKNILEKIINKEKQKVIIKSDHEFFSNSTPDVFENRLVKKMKTVGEQEHFQFKIQTNSLRKRKPYQVQVLYEVSKKFTEKFQDLSQQVFTRMLQEDENLRRKHQDQPYQETTTSLFKQYNLDFDSIKALTTRSDIIITSTMKFSLQKKQLEQNFEEYHPPKFQEILVEDYSPQYQKRKTEYKDKTYQEILDLSQIQSRGCYEIDVDDIDDKMQSTLKQENQTKKQKKVSQLQQSTEREGVGRENSSLIHHTKFVNDSILSEFNKPNIKLRKENQSSKKSQEQNLVGMQKVSSQIEIHDSTNLFKNDKEIIDQNNENTLLSQNIINAKTIGQQLQLLSAFRVKRSLTGINNISHKKHPEGILKVDKVYQEDKQELNSENQKQTRKSKDKLESLGYKIQQSIVNWNIDVYSIDKKYRKSFFCELNKRMNKSEDETQLLLLDDLKNMQKNIKEFKGHKIWFDQMSKKEFIEDHQTTFLKFLDETVQIKEQKNFYQGEEISDSEAERQREKEEMNNISSENDLSDLIPSSLQSEYEEVKNEIRLKIVQENRSSKSFALMLGDVRNSANKNLINIEILKRLQARKSQIKARWSGSDVLVYSLISNEKVSFILNLLNKIRIWPQRGKIMKQKTKTCCFKFKQNTRFCLNHSVFDFWMTMIVLFNTALLVFDNNQEHKVTDFTSICNMIFTVVFFIEMILKLFAFGIKKYLVETINILDGFIVIMSLVELITTLGFENEDGKVQFQYQIFRTIRVFRVLRFLRMARLLRQLHSMQIIISVLQRSFEQFIYVALLLTLFLFTYALLGMQLFGNIDKSMEPEKALTRINFANFHQAFIGIYQVLTISNWNQVMYDTMYFTNQKVVAAIYYVSFIMIGNYIFLNLFLAILIDSFTVEGENQNNTKKEEGERLKEFQKVIQEIQLEEDLQQKEFDKQNAILAELNKKILSHQVVYMKKKFWDKQNISRQIGLSIMSFFKQNKKQENDSAKQEQPQSAIKLSKMEEQEKMRKVLQMRLKLTDSQRISRPIVEDLTEQEISHLVKILNRHINYDSEFLTNKNLVQLSKGSLQSSFPKEILEHPIVLFQYTKCDKSFFIFSNQNKFRIAIMKLLQNKTFDQFIVCIIVLSSAKLAVETYYLDAPSEVLGVQVLNYIDYGLSFVFTIEAIMKIIALGLIFDQGTYLRYIENIMDLLIVITSLIDIGLSQDKENSNLSHLKVFRLLRTMRPIRIITHSHSMQVLLSTLLQSLAGIFNVLLLIVIVWFMFSILGVSLLGKKLIYCSAAPEDNPYLIVDDESCKQNRGNWVSYPLNYDSVLNGMLTLLVTSSLNNWDTLMYQAIDANQEMSGPIQGNSPGYAYFYIFFILLCSFFLLNLLIGVLFMTFKEVQEDINRKGHSSQDDYDNNKIVLEIEGIKIDENDDQYQTKNFSKEQQEVRACWRDIQRMIITAEIPTEEIRLLGRIAQKTKMPFVDDLRAKLRLHIGPGKLIDNVFTVIIILNTIVLATHHSEASQKFNKVMFNLNIVFTVIYIIEALLKIFTYGSAKYARFIYIPRYFTMNNWNRFDFLLVLTSIIELGAQDQSGQGSGIFKRIPQLIRVLRILRVARIFRLVDKYEALKALLSTIVYSISPILTVFALLVILLFISAVLGVYLFRDIVRGEVIDLEEGGYVGFSNFGMAMLMLFRMTTGEDWSNIYTDTVNPNNCAYSNPDCTTPLISLIYFVSFNLMCGYLILNLFVLIALEQFDRYYLPKDNVIAKFRKYLDEFSDAWSQLAGGDDMRIKEFQLPQLLKNLKYPLGFDQFKNEEGVQLHIEREVILKMGIRVDPDSCVHFHEVLFRVMQHLFGTHSLLQELDMQLFELMTLARIEEITQANFMKLQKKKQIGGSIEQGTEINYVWKKTYIANPLFARILGAKSFQAWLNMAKKEKVIEQQVEIPLEVNNEVLVTASSSEDEEEVKIMPQDEAQDNLKLVLPTKILEAQNNPLRDQSQFESPDSINQIKHSSHRDYQELESIVAPRDFNPSVQQIAQLPISPANNLADLFKYTTVYDFHGVHEGVNSGGEDQIIDDVNECELVFKPSAAVSDSGHAQHLSQEIIEEKKEITIEEDITNYQMENTFKKMLKLKLKQKKEKKQLSLTQAVPLDLTQLLD